MSTKTPQSFPFLQNNFYFKNWCRLFAITLLAYMPFICVFLWGNHDWDWIKTHTQLSSGLFEGRFSQFFLQSLLFEGNILPVLTLSCSLALYSAAAILLLNLWKLPLKNHLFILLGLNLTTAPYTLSWLYFAWNTLSCLAWPLFIIFAFWLFNHKPLKIAVPLSILLYVSALGGYPPIINMIGVLFFSLLLNDLCFQQKKPNIIFQKYMPIILTTTAAIILFLIIRSGLIKFGIQQDTYNTASISFNDLAEKLPLTLTALHKQFFLTQSFISAFYKYVWAGLTITALWIAFNKLPKNLTSKILYFLCVFGLFFSPLLTLLIAQNSGYVLFEPRIEFFGIIYIYIYSASIIFKSASHGIRNLAIVLIALLTLNNFHTLAYAAKTWQLGFAAETKFSERFINRIEENPAFSARKTYTFVQGGTLDFRSRYYIDDDEKKDSYTLTAPYIPWHLPSKAYGFYYPQEIFATDFDIFWSFVQPQKLHPTDKTIRYLGQTAAPWPETEAVYVDDNIIILTLTPTGKLLAEQWLQKHKIIPHFQ